MSKTIITFPKFSVIKAQINKSNNSYFFMLNEGAISISSVIILIKRFINCNYVNLIKKFILNLVAFDNNDFFITIFVDNDGLTDEY